MAYCVNCGVELQAGEPRCPLCGIESVNPFEPVKKVDIARPYPVHVERLNRRIDRHYIAICLSLILLIPLFICAFCDLLVDGGLSWSAYVAGGLGVVFVWFLLPTFFAKRRALKCVLFDAAAAAGMLLLVERMTQGDWFLRLGLPLVVLVTAEAALIVGLSSPRLGWRLFSRLGVGIFGCAVLVVYIEYIIMLYNGVITLPKWSAYAFIPLVIISITLFLFNRRADMQEQLKKRFFI